MRTLQSWILYGLVSLMPPMPALAAEMQHLHGQVPTVLTRLNLRPLGRLPGSQQLRLAIGLPLRNKEALTNLLQDVYDPASPQYRHYLSPSQFTKQFGP